MTAAPLQAPRRGRPKTDEERRADWVATQTEALILAIRAGRATDAFAVADAVLEQDPESIELVEMATDLAAKRHDWPRLLRYRVAIAAIRPDDRTARIAVVRALSKAGLHAAADQAAGRLLDKAPDTASLLRLRLETRLAGASGVSVAQWVEHLSQTPAGRGEAFAAEVSQMLAQAGQFSIANAWLDGCVARHGRTASLIRQQATLAYRRRDWEAADALWAEVQEADDGRNRLAALLHRGRIAINRDRRDEATAHYAAVLEEDPVNAEAARHVVRQAISDGRLDDAQAAFDAFVQSAGDSPLTIWLAASMASARGDPRGASRLFAEGVERWPDDLEMRMRWADMLADAGDWSAMNGVLAEAERLGEEDPAWLQRRLRLGFARLEPAPDLLQLVERSLLKKPDDEGLLRQKANLLIRVGQRREAVAVLLGAMERFPASVGFYQAAAANLLILNENAEVDRVVDAARAAFADATVGARLALAEVLEAADRVDDAVVVADDAIRIDPAAPGPRILSARLWEIKGEYRKAWTSLVALSEMSALSGRAAMTYARVAKALAYVDARPVPDAEHDLFPHALFDRLSREARPDADIPAPVVLHVTGSLAAGGAERQVALTVAGLARRPDLGLTPVLVAQDLNPLVGRDFFLPLLDGSGTEVLTLADLRAGGAVRDLAAAQPRHREALALLAALPQDVANIALPLYALTVDRRPQVVHLWQDSVAIAGGIAAMAAGVPRIVLGARSTRPIERQRARPWLHAGYHALLRYPGTLMLNNSRNGARDYGDWLGIDPAGIQPVYNGYDFEALRSRVHPALSADIRSRLNAGPADMVIGGVMRCSFEKRPELWTEAVIELCRRDSRVRGLLVGEGPMKDELEARVAEAGQADRIHFVGRQAPVEPWMKAMDILFLSSLTEGLPNVLIEAQALGVAVASMRVGGAPETVLEDVTATLIDNGTIDSIVDALTPLVDGVGLRQTYGAAGEAHVQSTFSADAMLERLTGLYGLSGPRGHS